MSEHAWSQEHVAAYVAGGLTAAEAERLEAHARDCPDCAAAVSAARRLDRGLGELFAAVRPGPGLEDRAIHALRTARRRRPVMAGWPRRVTVAVAALLILGTFGALAGSLINDGMLPMPGAGFASSRFQREGNTDVAEATHLDSAIRSADRAARRSDAPFNVAEAPAPPAGGPGSGSGGDQPQPLRPTDRVVPPGFGTGGFGGGGIGSIGGIGGAGGVQGGGGIGGMEGGIGGGMMVPPQGYNGIGVRSAPVVPGTPAGTVANGGAPAGGPGFPGMPGGLGLGSGAPPGGPAGGQASRDSQKVAQQVQSALSTYSSTEKTPPGTSSNNLNYFRPDDAKPAVPEGQPKGEPKQARQGGEERPTDDSTNQKSDVGKGDKENKGHQGAGAKPNEGQPPAPEPQPAARRVVIRSGDMEFEVDSFDAAVATVTKLVTGIKGAFVATVNSEKLPNGKVWGSITVRTPPEALDGLVLDLRKELGQQGELKGVKISSQDITKHYTDLESRLKAARTMEQRLIQIIKEGKGEIKQLLEAERELGVWRTKIEEFEGEIRYLGNLAALSTLTVTLTEKEIRAAVGVTESERVQAGVEVEDVDKAYQAVLTAVLEAKGRVTKSELKQLSAGQFNATLHFEVAPEQAGPLRDRLRQLGRVARLEIDRVQQAEGGVAPKDAKVKRGDTVFLVQLYNLANVAPRETATMQVAVPAVPAAYATLREAVEKAKGRVLNAQLNEQDPQNVTAQLDFDVRRTDEGTVRAALEAAGDVIARQVTRAPESDNVTDTKVLYRVGLFSTTKLRPRETATLAVEVANVDQTAAVFAAQAAEAKGRQLDAHSERDRNGRVTAHLVYEVPLATAGSLVERFKEAGKVRAYQSARDPQAVDGRFATARIDVTLSNEERIVAEDEGLWPQVRRGLSYSAAVLLTSVTWVVFGLCVVLPWAVVGYVGYRLLRWLFRGRPVPATAPVTSA